MRIASPIVSMEWPCLDSGRSPVVRLHGEEELKMSRTSVLVSGVPLEIPPEMKITSSSVIIKLC